MLALAREAVTNAVVQTCGGLIIDGGADEDVLVFLGCVIGDVIEVPRVRYASGGDAVVSRATNLRGSVKSPTKIGCRSGDVEFIVGQVIGGLQPTVVSEIVKLLSSISSPVKISSRNAGRGRFGDRAPQ